jgi:hypothetical protein
VWEHLNTIIGLAGIGAVIDFIMGKAGRERLQKALDHWWLQFGKVKCGNFGQQEADAAVAMLDRWAGSNLLSWQRWQFGFVVGLMVAVFSFGWFLYSLSVLQLPHPLSTTLYTLREGAVLMVPLALFYFGLSFSFTRAIAIGIGRMCTGTILDVFLFILLLTAQWLVYVGGDLLFSTLFRLQMMIRNGGLPLSEIPIADYWRSPLLLGGWFPIPHFFVSLRQHGLHLIVPPETSFKVAMDALASTLRLGFTFVFLVSFAFQPLIKPPISWFWLRVLESGRGFFTLLFSVIGILIKLGQWVLS